MTDFAGLDVFDSRSIDDRIEELENDIDENTDDEELETLLAFRDDVGSSEWGYGITFIADSYFEDYARDYADDMDILSNVGGWPFTCINWEQAAADLQMNYSAVELDGYTYWFLA